MMKKAAAALCSAVFLIVGCLSGCSTQRTALTVGGAEINSEVYVYFLDLAARELSAAADAGQPDSSVPAETVPESAAPAAAAPTDPSVPAGEPEATAADARNTTAAVSAGSVDLQSLYDRAAELCADYVAVNSLFAAYDCTLSVEEKSTASVRTNDLWRLYGSYYESLGVSKQTLYKIEYNSVCRDAVLDALYGADGTEPVPEAEVRKYYEDHHIVFRAISGYYTDIDEDGNTVPMSDEQRAATDSTFASMADRINAGTDMDTVYNDYLESLGNEEPNETVSVRVASSADQGYPEGFFETVHALEQDKASVVRLGDYIYVIVRMDPYTGDSVYYEENKAQSLRELKAEDFKAVVRQCAEEYEITVRESVQKSCLRKVRGQHEDVIFE